MSRISRCAFFTNTRNIVLIYFFSRARISPPMYSRPYLIASLWFGEKSHGMQRVKMNSIHAEPMLAAASLLCDSWQPVLSRMTDPKRGKRHISTMGGSLVCLLLLYEKSDQKEASCPTHQSTQTY